MIILLSDKSDSISYTVQVVSGIPGLGLAKQCWVGTQGVKFGVNVVCKAR